MVFNKEEERGEGQGQGQGLAEPYLPRQGLLVTIGWYLETGRGHRGWSSGARYALTPLCSKQCPSSV